MKYSIIITTYNRFDLLSRAVESALKQTLECEVIVVDDNSDDKTQKYLKSFSNKIIYHRNHQNMGHSASVNIGVELSSGDWIKLLDDDDYLLPECIARIDEVVQDNPEIVIVSCPAFQINEQGDIIGKSIAPINQILYIKQEDIHYQMLLERLPFGTTSQVAFKKDAFMKSGGWDSRFDGNYDEIFSWVKISQHGDAILLNDYLVYRMIWSGSISRNIPFDQRFAMNVVIKEKTYELVSSKYKHLLPKIETIEKYLRLHWGFVTIKQKDLKQTWQIVKPAIFSLSSWQLFIKIQLSKRYIKRTFI